MLSGRLSWNGFQSHHLPEASTHGPLMVVAATSGCRVEGCASDNLHGYPGPLHMKPLICMSTDELLLVEVKSQLVVRACLGLCL